VNHFLLITFVCSLLFSTLSLADKKTKKEKSNAGRKISNSSEEDDEENLKFKKNNFFDHFACGRLFKKIYADVLLTPDDSKLKTYGINTYGVDKGSKYQNYSNFRAYSKILDNALELDKPIFGEKKINIKLTRIKKETRYEADQAVSIFTFEKYLSDDTKNSKIIFEKLPAFVGNFLELSITEEPIAEISNIKFGYFGNKSDVDQYIKESPPMEFQFNSDKSDGSCSLSSVKTCLTRNMLFGDSMWGWSDVDPDNKTLSKNEGDIIPEFPENYLHLNNVQDNKEKCKYTYTISKELCENFSQQLNINSLDKIIDEIIKGAAIEPDAIVNDRRLDIKKKDIYDNFLRNNLKKSLDPVICAPYVKKDVPVKSFERVLCYNEPHVDKILSFLGKNSNAKEENELNGLCDLYPYRTMGIKINRVDDFKDDLEGFDAEFLSKVSIQGEDVSAYKNCFLVHENVYDDMKKECIEKFYSLKASEEVANLHFNNFQVQYNPKYSENPLELVLRKVQDASAKFKANYPTQKPTGCVPYIFRDDNLYSRSKRLYSSSEATELDKLDLTTEDKVVLTSNITDFVLELGLIYPKRTIQDDVIFNKFFEKLLISEDPDTKNMDITTFSYCLTPGNIKELTKQLKIYLKYYRKAIEEDKFFSELKLKVELDNTLAKKLNDNPNKYVRQYFPFERKKLNLAECGPINYFRDNCARLFGDEKTERSKKRFKIKQERAEVRAN